MTAFVISCVSLALSLVALWNIRRASRDLDTLERLLRDMQR